MPVCLSKAGQISQTEKFNDGSPRSRSSSRMLGGRARGSLVQHSPGGQAVPMYDDSRSTLRRGAATSSARGQPAPMLAQQHKSSFGRGVLLRCRS
mmetsp:Transcript_40707/g.117533  ORF Transcript_40707/g.117533 Transcript_40707/m.117533 type:complete len:95 (-) Transcript_40707:154-438(-)